MAYKPHRKGSNGELIEIPLFAEKTEKDSDGNVIKTTYLKIVSANALFDKKADKNNDDQDLVSKSVTAKNGIFDNIKNQMSNIDSQIVALNQNLSNINQKISNINAELTKKIFLSSYGSVSLTSKITITGWYALKQMKDGDTIAYDLEIVFPTFNISNLINQNADTVVTINGLPAFNSVVGTPVVIITQSSPGPTNDYMNSQSGQYESVNPSSGTMNIRLRRAYSEAYTYCTIFIKGIIK